MASDWEARAYCGRTCIWAARIAGKLASTADVKTCTVCGKEHTRPAKLSGSQWARRVRCADCCSKRAPRVGRCEVCRRALPTGRKTRPPWCSKPCKAQWQEAHPKEQQPSRARRAALEDADPPVRFRSEVLPDGAPREIWIQRQPGAIAVCCGRCGRRFPRPTIRLAERLRRIHERVCGRGE